MGVEEELFDLLEAHLDTINTFGPQLLQWYLFAFA
jgi:hypothetical protein